MTIDIPTAARRAVAWQLRRPGPVNVCDVIGAAIRVLGLPEEQTAGDILDAVNEAIRAGRITCSTASDDGREIVISANTVLCPIAGAA